MADLELKNISKHFGGIAALQNVSLACNRGEVHALLGENGAGKSTLIKILSGAHQADSGEISLFGKTVKIKNPSNAIEQGIGTVYQELSIIPELTVSENIFIGRIPTNRFGRFNDEKLYEMTKALFEKYDVKDIDPNAKAGTLSLSKRQMIEILRVLSKEPEIIILDEATSALMENMVEWLLSLARKLADQGKIVIFISHRMAEITSSCDKITILRNGETVCEIDVKEINMDEVVALMLGRKIEGYYPELVSHVKDEKVLEVKNLTYGRRLNGVDLHLKKGEVLGIGGLAGQGQNELLLALYGVIKAKGEILLNGKPSKIKSPEDGLKKGIALVPEERATEGLLLDFSIGHNISLASMRKLVSGPFLSKKKEKKIVEEYIKLLQIKSVDLQSAVTNLSGGNQQKVVLAKILATEPSLLLMHDITRGIDVGTKKEVFALVRKLAQQGNAILYFSTDCDELVNMCDRVLVMFDGKVGATFEGENMIKENIVGAYIGETISS
ncbi:MAG: sugar ABC transporter ATP-binding protein [Eubacteriales bacterium]